MIRPLVAFACGTLFAIGLVLAGMEQPGVILGAFSFDERWDPRLALLFLGANLVTLPVTAWMRARRRTLLGEPLAVLPARPVDPRLLLGAALFGVGWGLAGVCPGPGLTAFLSGEPFAVLFCLGFAGGVALHHGAHVALPPRRSIDRTLTPREET